MYYNGLCQIQAIVLCVVRKVGVAWYHKPKFLNWGGIWAQGHVCSQHTRHYAMVLVWVCIMILDLETGHVDLHNGHVNFAEWSFVDNRSWHLTQVRLGRPPIGPLGSAL
jgi:hypothetical protein